MPPQQPDRLLDLIDDVLDFRAHGSPIRTNHWCRRGCSDCAMWTQAGRPHLAAASNAAPVATMGKQEPIVAAGRYPEKAAAIAARAFADMLNFTIRRRAIWRMPAIVIPGCIVAPLCSGLEHSGWRSERPAERRIRKLRRARTIRCGSRRCGWSSPAERSSTPLLTTARFPARCFAFAKAARSASISATIPTWTISCTGTVSTCPRSPTARWRKDRRWCRGAARSATNSPRSLRARAGITATTWPGPTCAEACTRDCTASSSSSRRAIPAAMTRRCCSPPTTGKAHG